MKGLLMAVSALALLQLTGCGGNSKPKMTSMQCEYVADGGEAVIYGKNFGDGEVIFPGKKRGTVIEEKSNDTMLVVKVPCGTRPGPLMYVTETDTVKSPFYFRDNRGIILNFDDKVATWGGFDPMDEEGDPVRVVRTNQDSVYTLPVTLPEEISGKYSLLYDHYNMPWTMQEQTFIQYMARPEEGGRGRVSIAGDNASTPLADLCFKFEIYVPEEVPYVGFPRIEIFFGPYDSKDKHGREISPICYWLPYETCDGEKYFTKGWRTVTIPLKQFSKSYRSADIDFEHKLNLKEATNLTFCAMGDATGHSGEFLVCVDNFRIVPIK